MTIMSHPQQPEAFAPYAPYNGNSMGNRSPTSTRTGYATLPSGMGASRQQNSRQPQQMDQRAQGIFPMQDADGILNNIGSRSPAQSTMPAELEAAMLRRSICRQPTVWPGEASPADAVRA